MMNILVKNVVAIPSQGLILTGEKDLHHDWQKCRSQQLNVQVQTQIHLSVQRLQDGGDKDDGRGGTAEEDGRRDAEAVAFLDLARRRLGYGPWVLAIIPTYPGQDQQNGNPGHEEVDGHKLHVNSILGLAHNCLATVEQGKA